MQKFFVYTSQLTIRQTSQPQIKPFFADLCVLFVEIFQSSIVLIQIWDLEILSLDLHYFYITPEFIRSIYDEMIRIILPTADWFG